MIELLSAESDRFAATITSHEIDPKLNNTPTVDPADRTLVEPMASDPHEAQSIDAGYARVMPNRSMTDRTSASRAVIGSTPRRLTGVPSKMAQHSKSPRRET